jgi:protein TonB
VRVSELGQQVDIGPRSWLTALVLVSVAHAVAVAWVSTHRATSVPRAAMPVLEATLLGPLPAPSRGLPDPGEPPVAAETEEARRADENPPDVAEAEPRVPAEPDTPSEPATTASAPLDPRPTAVPAPPQTPPPKIAHVKAAQMRSNRAAAPPARGRRTDDAGAMTDGGVPTAVVPATGPRHDAAYLRNPAPHYPAAARRQNMQGRVVIFAVVSPAGSCARAEVRRSSGHPILDEAALQAVRSWRFLPATRDGQPVAAEVEIPILFRLEG